MRSRWQTVCLSEVASISGGGRLKLSGKDFVEEGFPAYGAGGLNGHLPAFVFEGPGIILGSVGTCGRCYLADGRWASLANTQVIRPDDSQVDCRFLWYQLNDPKRWHITGTAQPFIKPADVKAHRVVFPPIEEQRRIVAVLDQADELRVKRQASIAIMDLLRESIFLEMFGDPSVNARGYPLQTLASLGAVVTGNTPSRANVSYYGDDIEWIKSDNIRPPLVRLTRSAEGLSVGGARIGRVAPAGSLLVTCIAGTPASIGNVALADRPVAFNQQINALIPAKSDSRYLHMLLTIGKPIVQRASTASMKGMISKSRFEAIELPVAPLELQRGFSARMSVADRCREEGVTSAQNIDALFASLQQRAFTGEL